MLPVSAEFLTAAEATVRKPRARVTITWTDPYIDLSLQASATDENRNSWMDQVADSAITVQHKWAHLNSICDLSGNFYPSPGTSEGAKSFQVGWWGTLAAGGGGAFSVSPVLTVEFSARPVLTLSVTGDSAYNEYPVDFVIRVYNGASPLYTRTVTANTALTWSADITAQNITAADKMTLTISKWSAVGRVAKITEFYTSIVETYDGDDVLSMNFLEELEIANGSLPIGNIASKELDLSIQNIIRVNDDDTETRDPYFFGNTGSRFHTLLKRNRRIVAELGFQLPDESIEYVPLGTFWSGDWQAAENGVDASTSARDMMELLRKTTFRTSEVYENATLYDLMETVLEDAATLIDELEYEIDAELDDYVVPLAYIKSKSHLAAIREIVEACMGRAYVDRSGVLQILGPSCFDSAGAADLAITKDDYFGREQPAKSEELANSIEVSTQPLAEPSAAEEVYRSPETETIAAAASVTINVQYSSPPVIEAVASLENESDPSIVIADATYYAWGCDVTIYGGSGGTFDLVVEGKPLTVANQETIVSEDTDSIRENGILRYKFPDNALVQTRAMAQDIADALLASYKTPRKDVSLEWRGNPALELADIVEVPEYQRGAIDERGDFAVTRQGITFEGGLTATIDGRKV